MEKVRLTQEQADAIEKIEDKDYAINVITADKRPDHVLMELETSELAKALYIGYKVESEFEVGDWVKVNWSNVKPTIHKVLGTGNVDLRIDGRQVNKHPFLDICENATPKEVAQEKERRWWRRYGRSVWCLEQGDLIQNKLTGKIEEIKHHQRAPQPYAVDSWKVVCFAEDRKDEWRSS